MRPRGVPSRWVKLNPWYYTRRSQPTRAAETRQAISSGYDPSDLVPIRRETVEVLLLNHADELASERADADLAELAYEYRERTGWTMADGAWPSVPSVEPRIVVAHVR